MKKILIILLFSTSLFSASIFTLDNVKHLSLYMPIDVSYIDQKQKEEIKKSAKKRLQKAGFVFGKPDAISFMLKVESINITNIEVINVQLSLGEEIITKRHENIESFALTYFANDFLEAEDPYDDTLESINFLISEFIDAYHDDNEQ